MQNLVNKPNLLFLIGVRFQREFPTIYLRYVRDYLVYTKLLHFSSKLRTELYYKKIKRSLSENVFWNNTYHIGKTNTIFMAGDILRFLNGRLHCENGPAIIYADRSRVDPASVFAETNIVRYNFSMKDGVEYWQYGAKHRTDGPACIFTDGETWYQNGLAHRVDGPAHVLRNYEIVEIWEENGRRHREDGPAITFRNGDTEWWLNGVEHRVDGPAKQWLDGSYEWWLNGELHRDMPYPAKSRNGTLEWWIHGKKHRFDGPAVLYAEGHDDEWWVDGNFIGYNPELKTNL